MEGIIIISLICLVCGRDNNDIEGSRPEWCISSMINIVEIHHSGREPSIFCFGLLCWRDVILTFLCSCLWLIIACVCDMIMQRTVASRCLFNNSELRNFWSVWASADCICGQGILLYFFLFCFVQSFMESNFFKQRFVRRMPVLDRCCACNGLGPIETGSLPTLESQELVSRLLFCVHFPLSFSAFWSSPFILSLCSISPFIYLFSINPYPKLECDCLHVG